MKATKAQIVDFIYNNFKDKNGNKFKKKKLSEYPREILEMLIIKHDCEKRLIEWVDRSKMVNHHICKYCGGIANGKEVDLLCDSCREIFGHAYYSEL